MALLFRFAGRVASQPGRRGLQHLLCLQRDINPTYFHHSAKTEIKTLLPCISLTQNVSSSQPMTCFQQRRNFRSEISKAVVLVKDLKHLSSSPKPALVLGLGGLVPFMAMPTYMMMSGVFLGGLAYSQVAYGACILSFVGAVRWGMALSGSELVQPNWFNIGYSVTPALVAWLALMFPTSMALFTLMGGLAGAAYIDLTMLGYPSWFKALRFLLTLGAILSLWTTLMCMLILPKDKKQKKRAVDKDAAPAVLESGVATDAHVTSDGENATNMPESPSTDEKQVKD